MGQLREEDDGSGEQTVMDRTCTDNEWGETDQESMENSIERAWKTEEGGRVRRGRPTFS